MAPSAPAQGVRTLESLAAKETQRRTALANQAMNDIQSGYDLLGEGKFEEALKVFEDSYQALPVTPLTQEARLAAQNGQVLAGIGHARTLQTEGKGKEAGALLESLLVVSPKDDRVLAVQKLFSDPDRWPPALTGKTSSLLCAVAQTKSSSAIMAFRCASTALASSMLPSRTSCF
jgi:tetratricopeptide (TPR) repeat protein